MKALPTSIGAEPKKLALLGGIVVVGIGLVYWINSGNDVPPQAAATPSGTAVPFNSSANSTPNASPPRTSSGASPGPKVPTRGGTGRSVEDFRPSIKPPEGVDLSRVDPRLKTELLARLRALPDEGGKRSVFEFYVPPAPPPPVAAIKPAPVVRVAPPPIQSKPAGPPPLPPIPLKLYGFAGAPGSKTRKAFFLDGEDILIGSENDMIRNRYRIVHIGILDAIVEDTTTKQRETIKIMPENDA